MQPTEQEQNTAQDIIRKVSEQYAEELISKDISDISNQIAATVREYCNQLDLTYEEQKRIEKQYYQLFWDMDQLNHYCKMMMYQKL